MKFEFNWPSGFRGVMFKNVDGWRDRRMDGRTDGRQSDWYIISSPKSLQLR